MLREEGGPSLLKWVRFTNKHTYETTDVKSRDQEQEQQKTAVEEEQHMGLARGRDVVVEGLEEERDGAKLVEERYHMKQPVAARERAQEDVKEEENAWAVCCTVAVGGFDMVQVLEDFDLSWINIETNILPT